jgi:hypothetical protein
VGDLRTAVGKDIAGNPLVQDTAIEWSRYWQAMHWRKEEWVLASNALA